MKEGDKIYNPDGPIVQPGAETPEGTTKGKLILAAAARKREKMKQERLEHEAQKQRQWEKDYPHSGTTEQTSPSNPDDKQKPEPTEQ